MTAISVVSMHSDQSFKPVALFCYFGFTASLCLLTFGMELSTAGF
jgi:hypothetical protein